MGRAFGCDGAWPNAYWDWIQGQYNQEESGYPYFSGRTGDIGSCKPVNSNAHSATYVTGFQNSWYTDEMDMENLLMINPVATAVSLPTTGEDTEVVFLTTTCVVTPSTTPAVST